MLTLPAVSPTLDPSRAARNASRSCNSSAVRFFVPALANNPPAAAAKPSLPLGATYLPVRTLIDKFTSGNSVLGTR